MSSLTPTSDIWLNLPESSSQKMPIMLSATPLVFHDALSNTTYASYSSTLTSSPAIIRQRSESSETFLRDAKRRRPDSNSLHLHSTPSPSPPNVADRWRQSGMDVALPPTVVMDDISDLDALPSWTYQPPELHIATPPRLQVIAGLPTPESVNGNDGNCCQSSNDGNCCRSRSSLSRSSTASSGSLTAKALALKAGASQGIAGPQRELRLSASGAYSNVAEASLPPRRSTEPARLPESSRKDFVTGLVGTTVIALESIWLPENPDGSASDGSVLPLHFFVREVLRRSRTSCSTLQVALYYLHKCRRDIREAVTRAEIGSGSTQTSEAELVMAALAPNGQDAYPSPPHSPVDARIEFAELDSASNKPNPILCGRRMFLASLIVASKFLQDRNYSNRAWAKISGLPVHEINENERVFLALMNFQLHLRAEDFQKWTERLAVLACQGAALEAGNGFSWDVQPARLGLSRHASEYPPAEPLHELRPVATAASAPRLSTTSILGRSRSEPSVLPCEPSSSKSGSTSGAPTAQTERRHSPLRRQTATPLDTPVVMADTSPGPTEGLNASSSRLSPSQSSRRRFMPLPATKKSFVDAPLAYGCNSAMGAGDNLAWARQGVQAH